MLQATRPAAIDIEPTQGGGSLLELASWALGIVRRQFLVMIFAALPVISLATLYAFTASPFYIAEATILIDPRKVQLFPGATFAEGGVDSSTLESQIELLKSERVGLEVIKKLS